MYVLGIRAIGPLILKAVQDEPAFNVTVIARHNSAATFSAGTKVVRVSDGYPDEEMVEAFKGQDAVVLSLGFQAEHRHSALVQASIKAGVKHLVASGYGANDSNAAVREMFPIAACKAQMVWELKSLEKPGWSWTAICCGLFFDLYVVNQPLSRFSFTRSPFLPFLGIRESRSYRERALPSLRTSETDRFSV